MMIEQIDLSSVYGHLVKILYDQSYILSDCITAIKKVPTGSSLSNHINTLAVDNKGILYISEEFCQKYITDEKCLTLYLLHELMHTVLLDTNFMARIDENDPDRQLKMMAANIAFDCRINAILYLVYEKELNVRENFARLFEESQNEEGVLKEPLHYILYPENSTRVHFHMGEEMYNIYVDYYSSGNIKDFYQLYILILDYLKNKNYGQAPNKIILIGSHGEGQQDGSAGSPIEQLGEKEARAIGQAISDAIQQKALMGELDKNDNRNRRGSAAGRGENIVENLIPLLEQRPDNTIPEELLRKLSINTIAKNIKLAATKRVAKWTNSPVLPQRLAKSDLMSVMMDMDVLLWKQRKNTLVYDPTLVPIYFDVSGSMTSYVPLVLELVLMIDAKIDHIWCFSDNVEKHTMKELKERKIRTTGGTCFDAVVRHIEEHNHSAVLIITDGECSVSHPAPDCLRDVVTILTPNGYKDNWFSRFSGTTFDLVKITEGKTHDASI